MCYFLSFLYFPSVTRTGLTSIIIITQVWPVPSFMFSYPYYFFCLFLVTTEEEWIKIFIALTMFKWNFWKLRVTHQLSNAQKAWWTSYLKKEQLCRYREQTGTCQKKRMGGWVKRVKKYKSCYKINKSWGCNVNMGNIIIPLWCDKW